VSEALAAGRPMVLVGACPGQETRNQTWLVEQGAAVAVGAAGAGAAVAALRDEGRLARLAEAARSLAAPRAAGRVVDVALRLVDGASVPLPLAA
jgi:UDP-N-acetylglucosamine:LPS N-acetylglucosamine transferase